MVQKITITKLAQHIIDALKNCNPETFSVDFAEYSNGEDGEGWHGAKIFLDGKEPILVIRYYGGYGNAFYATLNSDYTISINEFTFATELSDYLDRASEYGGNYDIDSIVYLEVKE